MRGPLFACALVFTAFCVARAADAPDYSNLADSARALDASTQSSLGISLRALSLLLKASRSGYMPVWSLQESGDLDVIGDLEAKGYVTVSRSSGLPDHTETGTEYLSYVATNKGKAVISAVMGSKR